MNQQQSDVVLGLAINCYNVSSFYKVTNPDAALVEWLYKIATDQRSTIIEMTFVVDRFVRGNFAELASFIEQKDSTSFVQRLATQSTAGFIKLLKNNCGKVDEIAIGEYNSLEGQKLFFTN